jgi:DNA polymerase-3 subunit gamma/tau
MLSNNAFNALLKTLEEPPAHVKFIFATTEIKKVPVTILSRCQRFDLRRLDEEEIKNHAKNILQKEGIEAEDKVLSLIAKISEGSVRDSLSILDQALANNNFNKNLSFEVVEKMLGLSDNNIVFSLLENLFEGNFKNALSDFSKFYETSSDISQLNKDLSSLVHKITLKKLIRDYSLDGFSKIQQDKIHEIANKISLSSLTRIWQILIKAIPEISYSGSRSTYEMLIARICHLSALPNLQQVLSKKEEVQNNIDPNIIKNDNELVNEVLRNFEGAKLV